MSLRSLDHELARFIRSKAAAFPVDDLAVGVGDELSDAPGSGVVVRTDGREGDQFGHPPGFCFTEHPSQASIASSMSFDSKAVALRIMERELKSYRFTIGDLDRWMRIGETRCARWGWCFSTA